MCHAYSIYPIFFNFHKNPAKPITTLHFILAETGGMRSPKKRENDPSKFLPGVSYCGSPKPKYL